MTDPDMLPIAADRQPVVQIEGGEAMADSRHVADYFGKQHYAVLRDIRGLHCSAEFRERNFVAFKINDLTGESTSHVMMTKNGFLFLGMGFTGEKAGKLKEAFVLRFDAMEAELRRRSAPDVNVALSDPATLRTLLLANTEKVLELQGQVQEMRPQVEAFERIAVSDGSLCITDAAKTLQIRPKDLFTFLRSHGWIYKRTGTDHDVAYQSKIVTGLLEHKTNTVTRGDGTEKTVTQVRVTPKGLSVLAKLLPPAVSEAA